MAAEQPSRHLINTAQITSIGASSRRLAKQDSIRLQTTAEWHELGDTEVVKDALVAKVEELNNGEIPDDIEVVRKAVAHLYPVVRGHLKKPTREELITSVVGKGEEPLDKSAKTLLYRAGMWIEYLGLDQNWHLGYVRRVTWDTSVKGKPKFFYNLGRDLQIPESLTRPPEEGIKLVFGFRPSMFEQWALIKLEDMARFQEAHEMDFEHLHFETEGKRLWHSFVHHEQNREFKEHLQACTPHAREKLENFVMASFRALDRITKQNSPGARWDFESAEISVYHYPSVFGSGWAIVCAVLFAQIAAPAILLISAVDSSDRFSTFFHTDNFSTFCFMDDVTTGVNWQGKVLNICVTVIYALSVLPKLVNEFFQAIGEGDTVQSRLNSIRQTVWDSGTDDLWMMLGFKLERYSKTVYFCVLNIIMLVILFLEPDPINIILNALQIYYIYEIDVNVAQGPFYDFDNRWIKAGVAELRIRASLHLLLYPTTSQFCAAFDVDYDALCERLRDKDCSAELHSRHQSIVDDANMDFFTKSEILWKAAGVVALQDRRMNAVWQFCDPPLVTFGSLDQALLSAGLSEHGVFSRYTNYHAWTVWREILFLAPVPRPGGFCESKLLASNRGLGGEFFLNFEDIVYSSPLTRFFWGIVDYFSFRPLMRTLMQTLLHRRFMDVPGVFLFKLVDGLFEWFAFFIIVLFPLFLLTDFAFIVACY